MRRPPACYRLHYAYADALLGLGREDEAREWFVKAMEGDTEGETDAVERLEELDGIVLDLGDDEPFEELDADADAGDAEPPVEEDTPGAAGETRA